MNEGQISRTVFLKRPVLKDNFFFILSTFIKYNENTIKIKKHTYRI